MKKGLDIPVKQRLLIARDIAIVFEYMHCLGIVHRDIKSHNILIDANFNVKVCDFGLAKFNVSFYNNFISLLNVYRLTLEKDQCNMQAHLHIWLLNFFRKDSMTNQLMCLHMAVFYGR